MSNCNSTSRTYTHTCARVRARAINGFHHQVRVRVDGFTFTPANAMVNDASAAASTAALLHLTARRVAADLCDCAGCSVWELAACTVFAIKLLACVTCQ